MARHTLLYGLGALFLAVVVVATIVIVRQPPEPGTAAAFRALSAGPPSPAVVLPGSVPVQPPDQRRPAADSCTSFNRELDEAAQAQARIGNQAEAQRLLSLRQTCPGAAQRR
ncbi:hypothetical protein [Falsiroseomonas selenitidurans]|uniref:Uncharacterized protein n=1 Tax=Falsiroseomonas selenitidurans TaxID=2716335 RepID=A0ABX1E4Y4_9PROT|nr:hypothetical protein [Falsiroseomonas selenitidurans]NKC30863.1 hypothetical protein [Falsiroseomonas selenitidurans]